MTLFNTIKAPNAPFPFWQTPFRLMILLARAYLMIVFAPLIQPRIRIWKKSSRNWAKGRWEQISFFIWETIFENVQETFFTRGVKIEPRIWTWTPLSPWEQTCSLRKKDFPSLITSSKALKFAYADKTQEKQWNKRKIKGPREDRKGKKVNGCMFFISSCHLAA